MTPSPYHVSLVDTRNSIAEGQVVYAGDDAGMAFEKAADARLLRENRGKWIRFQTPQATKWAEVY